MVADNPKLPRDPDKLDADQGFDNQRERGVPNGLANEIFVGVYERPASFEPEEGNLERMLFAAYEDEVGRIDTSGRGIITALLGDIDTATDGFPDNTRLYLPATAFGRFAVTARSTMGYSRCGFHPVSADGSPMVRWLR